MPTPLDRIESIDTQLNSLLDGLPSLERALDQCLATATGDNSLRAHSLTIGNRTLLQRVGERLTSDSAFNLAPDSQVSHGDTPLTTLDLQVLANAVEVFCQHLRQSFFASLADFWAQTDHVGHSRQKRLTELRKAQLLNEIELRLGDQTLHYDQAYSLRICVELALPWQRQHLPLSQRPQVYRPLLSASSPNWRAYLPGTLVIVQTGPQGAMLEGQENVGSALLYSLAHGIEAFASLNDLHTELCERLDDPHQSAPLLKLATRTQDRERAAQAERLRYEWSTASVVEEQVQYLLSAQRARLSDTWLQAWNQRAQGDIPTFDRLLLQALDLRPAASSKGLLATRYALLLEKHLPTWLRSSSQQAITQIMQTLQELVAAIDLAAAPGILTAKQFNQRNTLLGWTQERLRERLRSEHGLDINPQDICVNVTMARQVGPVVHPLLPTGYIAVSSRPQVGDSIELVSQTWTLDELALLNVAWFDIDYWLTARVYHVAGLDVAALTPDTVKTLVRTLDAGSGYARFVRTHLLDSDTGQWRQQAHININRARMRAEAAKARHAGHFLADPLELGYRWASVILKFPDSAWRATVEEHRISVRQLVIQGHTVQGVLLLSAEVQSVTSFVLYTPNAPDRRPWREYRNPRELLQSLRKTPALRRYVLERLPFADGKAINQLLRQGRLGPHLRQPSIDGNWCEAYYRAEVQAVLAAIDHGSRTTTEMNIQSMITVAWWIVDLISLVLPNRALSALAFGRTAIDVWDALAGLRENDLEAVLRHTFNALAHYNDGISNYAGSTLMRRALRGIPKTPPLPLPQRMATTLDSSPLRYRIDGIYGEGVYEKPSAYTGLTQYFVKDQKQRYYQVSYDGQRWRAIDPKQPDSYLKIPLRRRQDGEWVIDSPVLWYDGLPDLPQLFADCQPEPLLTGTLVEQASQLYRADGQLYLQTKTQQLPLRPHLLADHYHLQIAQAQHSAVPVWAVLRWKDKQWRIRVRQTGRSSDWLPLPALSR